jgi:two-component system, OmpR family, response regulator CpxR
VASSILSRASSRHNVPPEKLAHSMEGPPSFLDSLRKDRPKHVAYVREALAEALMGPPAVFHGFGAHLLPRTVSHAFKVCLVGGRVWRVEQAVKGQGLTERRARKAIEEEDLQRIQWTQYLFDLGPWDERLYDEMIPMHTTSVDEAVKSIVDHAKRPILAPNAQSRAAAEDFLLAAQVGVAIAEAGLEADVQAAEGQVTLLINKHVSRLERLEVQLHDVALKVPGVRSAVTRLGPRYRPPAIHSDLDLPAMPRVLLVDDEKEFVHTLSERLESRDLGAAVAYDGEDALSFVESQAPEVMVLDLRMPGIDGLEVLRRVKREHKEVEVIILTGHGSEREEAVAQELGAFAYLHKPVDIEVLAKKMREAYRKIQEKRAAANESGAGGGDAS